VRLGALGDAHAIPVAAALRRAFPSAKIDWLVSAKHRAILDLVPVIDRRLVVNDRGDASGGTSLLAAIRELRRARYDVAIDVQGLIKSALFARSSGAARVIGFSSRYLREPLARLFYTDVHDPGRGGLRDPRETRHVVETNLGLLEPLGIAASKPEFPIDAIDAAVARDVSRQTGGRYALLNPGAAWPNKRWPPSRFASVAVELRARHGLMSVALWGPGEETLAAEVVAGAGGAPCFAEDPIADLAAPRGAALMVSGDTGPASRRRWAAVVGIYGTDAPARNGPISPLDVTVSRDAVCQCHHLRRCTRDRMCLLDIAVAEVLEAVERRLAAAATRA
jgi:ADP-heptose:LPS heptosyltransferase